jgi:hypothetical protein
MKVGGWIKSVAINLIGIAIAIGAAEAFARYHANATKNFSDTQLPMCRPDDLTIWRYKPDVNIRFASAWGEFDTVIKTNDVGLRGPQIAEARPGQATVLFIGDSFTFGQGVQEEDRFSSVAGRKLEVAGLDVRIINAGHWMYTYDQQLVLMKEMIRRFHPKIVVQGFFWPHIRTMFGHEQHRSADGQLVSVSDDKIKVDENGVLKFRSDWLERPPLNSQLIAMIARAALNRALLNSASRWFAFLRPDDKSTEPLWQLTDSLVSEAATMLREQGITYVPFLVPASVEVGGNTWGLFGWTESAPPTDVDIGLPSRRFKSIFARTGTPLLDPSQALRERGGGRLYFERDGHWNADGHRVIGELLANAIAPALKP